MSGQSLVPNAAPCSALFRLAGVKKAYSFTPGAPQFAELGRAKPFSSNGLSGSVLYPRNKADLLFEPVAPCCPTLHMGRGPRTLAGLPLGWMSPLLSLTLSLCEHGNNSGGLLHCLKSSLVPLSPQGFYHQVCARVPCSSARVPSL